MSIFEVRTFCLECDDCGAQTMIMTPLYPRDTDLPEGWTELPKEPPRREKHHCPACMTDHHPHGKKTTA